MYITSTEIYSWFPKKLWHAAWHSECTKRQRIFSYAQQDFGENIMDYASSIYFIYIYFTFIYSIGTQFKDHNDDQLFTLRNCKKYLTIAWVLT